MKMSSELYRKCFIEACLQGAPVEAAAWMARLDDLARNDIAPLAAQVDRQARFPEKSIAMLREIGAFGAAAPERAGGLGYGKGVAALMVETVAAACPSTAAILMFHNQVMERIARFGCGDRHRRDLEMLATGRWSASSAWTELNASADKSGLATRFVPRGDGGSVRGEKHFCTGLEGAGLFHVLLDHPADDGTPRPTFVRVERAAKGVDVSNIYGLMGLRGSSTGALRLSDVEVDACDLIGEVGEGMRLMRANHETLMNPGLLALGVARTALETAKRGVLGLSEGSRNTSNLPNVRTAIAEMEFKLAAAYAFAASVARLAQEQVRDIGVECIKVKAYASETACEIVGAVVRIAGGRGFAVDWPYERHFRDAHATVLMGPSNDLIRERVAASSLAEVGN